MSLEGEDDVELVVATTFRLDPPLRGEPTDLIASEDGLHVELDDGRRIRLAADDERSAGFARVLDGASEIEQPVALVIDGADRLLRLHLPHVSPVRSVAPGEGGDLNVELLASHGQHLLRQSHPRFEEFAGRKESGRERSGSRVRFTSARTTTRTARSRGAGTSRRRSASETAVASVNSAAGRW